MKLNKRERILAAAVGVTALLAILILAWQYVFTGGESLSALQARFTALDAKVNKKKEYLAAAKRAAVKLDDWIRRSLPSNVEKGRSLYQTWLRETVNKAGFSETKIDALTGQSRRGVFEELRYSIKAQASLQQLTQFLFDFYRAGHLHKISILSITPVDKSKDFTVNVTVEALALNDADRTDRLTKEQGKRLQKQSFDDYKKTIVDRNVFTAYVDPKPKETERRPPREEIKPQPPKFEHLEFTKLTAIVEIDGQPQAWIETKTTGKSYKARVGEDLDIASAKIKVLRIGTRDIELQIGDEKRTITLGQNLLAKP
jgi:hypothetical protein